MTIKEFTDFMQGSVYKDSYITTDCTNNGASSKYNRLYVVASYVQLADVEEFCKDNPSYKVEQFFKLDYEFYSDHKYCRLEPIDKGNKWYMFGGNYLASSDSRFKEFVRGCKYPVAIHDRHESYDTEWN